MYKNAYYPKIFTCCLSSLGRKMEEDGGSQVERVLTEKPWKKSHLHPWNSWPCPFYFCNFSASEKNTKTEYRTKCKQKLKPSVESLSKFFHM